MKDFYTETRHCGEKLKKTQVNAEIHHVHGLQSSVFLRCYLPSNCSTDSTQF